MCPGVLNFRDVHPWHSQRQHRLSTRKGMPCQRNTARAPADTVTGSVSGRKDFYPMWPTDRLPPGLLIAGSQCLAACTTPYRCSTELGRQTEEKWRGHNEQMGRSFLLKWTTTNIRDTCWGCHRHLYSAPVLWIKSLPALFLKPVITLSSPDIESSSFPERPQTTTSC